jgi:Sec-independent protein translocase protein TatA
MRGLGKGVKSFKQGMNEVEDELKKPLEDLDKSNKPDQTT